MLKPEDAGIEAIALESTVLQKSIPTQVSRTDAEVTAARVASQELLKQSGIARVICVDDCYAVASQPVDEVVAALKADLLSHEDKLEIAAVTEILSPLADDGLPTTLAVSLLEGSWESISDAHRLTIMEVINKRLGSDLANGGSDQDPDAASRLRELLEKRHEYLTLTLQQWRARRSDLLHDGTSTLVLFDRDFSREGAATDAGEDEVERLLVDAPGNWRIGLLTHTVSDSDAEVSTWRTLNGRFRGKSSRFLVIGKGRLAQAPREFPRMLKLTLLAPALEEMQHHVHEAVQEVWRQAHDHARELDPYTLEAALTGDRIRDGAWGPETLLRVTSAFTQSSIRARLRANDLVHEASSYVATLSRINLPEIPDQDRVRQDLAKIERLEYYESPEHLNELCFPIEPGDIFAVNDFDVSPGDFEHAASPGSHSEEGVGTPTRSNPKQYWILLAQPCDLAIRGKGIRSNNLAYARLAPLKAQPDRVISQPGGSSATAFDLPFFDSSTGSGVEVKLSQQRIAPLTALDMCALNPDGAAHFSSDHVVSRHVVPNWRKRSALLQKWVREVLAQYSEMTPYSIPGRGAETLTRALTGTGAWPELPSLISLRERTIFYGITRVGRLREPYRSALLSRMAQREARDAFDPSLLDK